MPGLGMEIIEEVIRVAPTDRDFNITELFLEHGLFSPDDPNNTSKVSISPYADPARITNGIRELLIIEGYATVVDGTTNLALTQRGLALKGKLS